MSLLKIFGIGSVAMIWAISVAVLMILVPVNCDTPTGACFSFLCGALIFVAGISTEVWILLRFLA
jgi:hypothetical protein